MTPHSSEPSRDNEPSPWIARALRRATTIAGLILISLSAAAPAFVAPSDTLNVVRGISLVLGIAIVIAAIVSHNRMMNFSLFVSVSSYMSILCILVLFYFADDIHWKYRGRQEATNADGEALCRLDARYGYAPIPDLVYRQHSPDWEVIYTTDQSGWRITPHTDNPLGRVLISGGSFTFGSGVGDTECYPYVLGQRYWPRFSVVNASVPGWGTTQALLVLERAIAEDTRPDMFLYGWIGHHLYRNYLRRTWIKWLDQPGVYRKKIPHFEIEDDALAFKGFVGAEDGLRSSKKIDEMEFMLTTKLLGEMHGLCLENGIAFNILILPVKNGDDKGQLLTRQLLDYLDSTEIPFIDLRGISESYYPVDPHPTDEWHLAIAEAIAEDPTVKSAVEEIRAGERGTSRAIQ